MFLAECRDGSGVSSAGISGKGAGPLLAPPLSYQGSMVIEMPDELMLTVIRYPCLLIEASFL